MLKRIKDRFSEDTNDVQKLSKYGYVPSNEEIETDLGWSEISKFKRDYSFEGNYHCQLCPKKLLNTQQELTEHLASKGHVKNVKLYFRVNKGALDLQIKTLYMKQSKRIKKYSPRFRQLSWLSHYFKVRGSLRTK